MRTRVLAVLLGVLTVLGGGVAVGAEPPAAAATVPLAHQQAQPVEPSAEPTPAEGPTLDPERSQHANDEKQQSKIVVGIIAVVLLLIVLWGRRVRGTSRKKIKAQAKGK